MKRFLPILGIFFPCLILCLGVTGIVFWVLMWYPDRIPAFIFAAVPLLTAGMLAALLIQRDRQDALEEQVRLLQKQVQALKQKLSEK